MTLKINPRFSRPRQTVIEGDIGDLDVYPILEKLRNVPAYHALSPQMTREALHALKIVPDNIPGVQCDAYCILTRGDTQLRFYQPADDADDVDLQRDGLLSKKNGALVVDVRPFSYIDPVHHPTVGLQTPMPVNDAQYLAVSFGFDVPLAGFPVSLKPEDIAEAAKGLRRLRRYVTQDYSGLPTLIDPTHKDVLLVRNLKVENADPTWAIRYFAQTLHKLFEGRHIYPALRLGARFEKLSDEVFDTLLAEERRLPGHEFAESVGIGSLSMPYTEDDLERADVLVFYLPALRLAADQISDHISDQDMAMMVKEFI